MLSPFPSPPLPFPPRYLLVRASFANKENITARGWGLGATARRIGGCDKHCEYNDAQPDRFSHGRRDRDVLDARKIAYAFMQSPSPSPPLPFPPSYLLVRASFAKKDNSTARGWGLGA